MKKYSTLHFSQIICEFSLWFIFLFLFSTTSKAQPHCVGEFAHYSISNYDSVHFYPVGGVYQTYFWDFGDGDTSTSQYPWHEYAGIGTYTVCLTVTDSNSTGTCSDTRCDTVHVGPNPPQCNAEYTFYSVNNPDSIHFMAATNSGNAHYYWSFGDGNHSTIASPWHFFANPGTYFVCLYVTDSSAGGTCSDHWCDSVRVGVPPPACNAHYTFHSATNPDSVHFISPSNPTGTNYYWSFGNGTHSNSAFPWHFYTNPGTYYVCLYVSDSTSSGTCHDLWCDSVHVGAIPPHCNAEFVHYSTTNPDSIHFYPVGTTATTYFWDFGDGDTSNQHIPWHLYANPGTYYACLTITIVTSAGTCTDTRCDSVRTVPTIPPPVCNSHFTFTIANHDSVHFVSALNSPTAHYYWSFGDGQTLPNGGPEVWHVYLNVGTYYVCLYVSDSTAGGTCVSHFCDSIHIGAIPPHCNAEFSHYPNTHNPDSIHFYPVGTVATTYEWTFGDGNSSDERYPWHIYQHNGTYYTCLTITLVTSTGTCTDTWCDSIHVGGSLPPVCNPHYTFYSANNPDSVHFISPSNSPTAHYYWIFGDGTHDTTAYPWHYFPHSGTYWVCLIVIDSTAGGTCSADHCDSIHVGVSPMPICNAHYIFYVANNPDSVHFIGPTNPVGSHFYWSFGDGQTSTSHDPWHYYPNLGVYYVCLYVTDSSSAGTCSDLWCDSIYVSTNHPICNAEFAHYSSLQNADSVHFYPVGSQATGYFWLFGDGDSSHLQYPWHYYSVTGTYYSCLTVWDTVPGRSCTTTWCDSVSTVRIRTGVQELSPIAENVFIYPNPADQFVTLVSANHTTQVDVEIVDATGRIIYRRNNFEMGSEWIDVRNLSEGIYIYRISYKNQMFGSGRLVVMHLK